MQFSFYDYMERKHYNVYEQTLQGNTERFACVGFTGFKTRMDSKQK